MAVKYCPRCPGKPYTKNLNINICPMCSGVLELEGNVDDSSLKLRPELNITMETTHSPLSGTPSSPLSGSKNSPLSGTTPSPLSGSKTSTLSGSTYSPLSGTTSSPLSGTTSSQSSGTTKSEPVSSQMPGMSVFPFTDTERKSGLRRKDSTGGCITIIGIMTNYDCREVHRLLITRLYHTLAYGQRFEDTLHSFTVTTSGENGKSDTIIVNVFGSMNTGANLRANSKVKVRGRFTGNNIFMADRIWVVNGDYDTPVDFQHDMKLVGAAVLSGSILILLAVLLFANLLSGNTLIGNLTSAVGGFIALWMFLYVLLLVLYFASFFTKIGFLRALLSRGKRKIPILILLLIVSFMIALLMNNILGIGDLLKPIISSGLQWGIMILLIVVGIGMILKGLR